MEQELSELYFAYGNNMMHATMLERIGSVEEFEYVGRARLNRHRLSFTTCTQEWEFEPVSDITPSNRFAVYGVLYRMTKEAFDILAPHEPTYELQVELVDLFEDDCDLDIRANPDSNPDSKRLPISQESAFVYCVKQDDKDPEGVPHGPYLTRILEAAESRKLPKNYLESIRSLAGGDCKQLLKRVALPTRGCGRRDGMPVVQLSKVDKKNLGVRRFVVVGYKNRYCLAKVIVRDELNGKGRICGVDENIRIRLNMPSIEPAVELYGACVTLSPVRKGSVRGQLLRPQHLILELDRTTSIDGEKSICVLDESILRLLGGEHGDKLKISSCDSSGKIRTVRRRATLGTTARWDYWPEKYNYPSEDTLHLDAADRELLGLKSMNEEHYHEKIKGYPLLVSVDIVHQIKKHVLMYLFSFFSVFVGAFLIANKFIEIRNADWGSMHVYAIILLPAVVAVVAVSVVIYFDVGNRVRS